MNIAVHVGWSQSEFFYAQSKGYCPVVLELDDGTRQELTIFDPVRLAQDLDIAVTQVRGSERVDAIVVPEVTADFIIAAVAKHFDADSVTIVYGGHG